LNPIENISLSLLRLSRKLHLTKLLGMGTSKHRFMDYFKGYEKVEAVKGIFAEKTEETLRKLKVEFIWFGYMGVDNTDGHLLVNARYLRTGNTTDIYLDIVHELCHVKQWIDGRELFDNRYEYVDRPTEIEAYRYTVQEAKRIGLSSERILLYLKTEWMSTEDLKRLVRNMQIDLK
jgi:hypothetical protein